MSSSIALACLVLALSVAWCDALKEMERERCVVHYVVDGDTFDCTLKGSKKVVTVRLLGIDTLEVRHGSKGRDECHGPEAEKLMRQLVLKKEVSLRSVNKNSVSGGGRRIARSVYVKQNGKWVDVARVLLGRGHAVQFTRLGESFHARDYNRVAAQAMKSGKNIWNKRFCGAGPAAKLDLFVQYQEKRGDLNSEYVTIKNTGKNAVNLKGWTLRPMLHVYAYLFKNSVVIKPGATLTVHTGKGTNTATDIYWGRTAQLWISPRSTGYGNAAYLVDPRGNFRFWYVYTDRSLPRQ